MKATKKRLQEHKDKETSDAFRIGMKRNSVRSRPMSASQSDLIARRIFSPQSKQRINTDQIEMTATTDKRTGPVKIHMDEEAIDRILANVAEH